MKRKFRKRLSIDMPETLAKEIKLHAILNNTTITRFICEAAIIRLKQEKSEKFDIYMPKHTS